MSIARQFGMQGSGKKAADKTAPEPGAELAKPLDVQRADEFFSKEAKKRPYTAPVKAGREVMDFIPDENVRNGTWEPSISVPLSGEMKAWGVRIDTAVLDLLKRNSGNQTRDAEHMILMYAAKMGWK